jgi:glyoxylase-like metal-dependent hydrolase (beta-lactamase superfamily II)
VFILPDSLTVVLIASFPAGPWQTNCYVVATEPGAECVIIDPGMDAVSGVRDIVHGQRLKPVSVMLTHGHLDHMYSVTPLCSSFDSTCWVHPADRVLLSDPLRSMGTETAAMLAQLTGSQPAFSEPDDVRELTDEAAFEIAGVSFSCLHTPGHTPGSMMFQTPYDGEEPVSSLVFSGDVLFAGSIGRTDLPGGSPSQMLRSLQTKVLPLPDATGVLPGHGPQTTVARERAGNPYLQEQYLAGSVV